MFAYHLQLCFKACHFSFQCFNFIIHNITPYCLFSLKAQRFAASLPLSCALPLGVLLANWRRLARLVK